MTFTRSSLISFLLCLLLLFTVLPQSVFAMNHQPNLNLSSRASVTNAEAGESIRLPIPIQNSGLGSARNLVISLDHNDESPIDLKSSDMRKSHSQINGHDQKVIYFDVTLKKNIPTGTYAIPFSVTYTDRNFSGSSSFSAEVHVNIKNHLRMPSIDVEEILIPDNQLLLEERQTVEISIKNTSDLTLKNLELELSGADAGALNISPSQRKQHYNELKAGSADRFVFSAKPADSLENRNAEVTLGITFEDEYGKKYESEEPIVLAVQKGGLHRGVKIEDIKIPTHSVESFEDFTLSFTVVNDTDRKLEGLSIITDGKDALLPKTPAKTHLKQLMPGERKTLSFTYFPTDGLESRNYPLEIQVKSSRSDQDSLTQYTGVMVGTPTSGSKPRIIVSHYDYHADYIRAGDPFPLSISFQNTHANESIRNIQVSFTSDGEVFAPVNSSNSLYIAQIQPSQQSVHEITLRPRPDADFQTHNLYADIKYEDASGNEHESRELIGIPVIQETTLSLSDVETGMEAFVGDPVPVSIDFYNVGRGLIRNLTISIEGDFETQDGSLYIGNMEAGSSNYYDATLFPMQEGTMEGVIIFQFDDEINQSHRLEKDFSIEVMEMMMPEEFPEDFEMHEPENTSSKSPWILLALLLIGGASFLWYRKRKKKKQESDMEDVEDDE
ncbi:COG1361 S-layer family protein [Tindallia californiensis]|uniref:LPXTG-motif cell wall anchor domain-containing protein n=1 Tax=Tindallia californiensis TaxID=159292 RepID=A0A1H3MBW1_9FIRM|nr:LPXTG cell wall anchor domain-containing protein [Tindallia californiensis]SDY74086.1 LPXTG-motif cell wall anchor domain-containing protein [Tindallia californiensis]